METTNDVSRFKPINHKFCLLIVILIFLKNPLPEGNVMINVQINVLLVYFSFLLYHLL